jgi:GH35 family endo-1,4-beta-xylanase
MNRRIAGILIATAIASYAGASARAQSFTGAALSHRSSGSGASDWTLSENGFVGTYFTLAAPGTVTLTANASGSTTDAVNPQMELVVADSTASFSVGGGFSNYQQSFDLPAGTYFVRSQFSNDVPTANRQLTVRSLTISGASSVSNTTSTATNDASALAAADTYIANYRRGPVGISLGGATSGAQVQVHMLRNEFRFGTMVQGFDANVFLGPVAPGDTTSTAARYQQFVNQHFNVLVPSNMGKWQSNESTQGLPTMEHVDTILNYAQAHGMDVRMHNLIWGTQQPTWVNTLIANASSSNPATAAQAKADLRAAITNRIAYYVGDGDADASDGDRSRKYHEIDVLNEALRDGTYWDIFGAAGIAEIYKEVQDAVTAAGSDARLFTNEYNVFNFANNPDTGVADDYANWYRRNVEDVNNAGFGDVVSGIGIQYNVDARTTIAQAHSPARMNRVLQNMAVTGIPVTLTEFAIPASSGGVTTTEQRAAQIYDESLRMLYGNPNATSFLIWEAWPPATTDNTTIFDANWNLRAPGQALVNRLDAWTTPDQQLTIGPDGSIQFNGYYGDYLVTVDGKNYRLSITKESSQLSLIVDLSADFDGDGDVDGDDLSTWTEAFNASTSAGDADGDGQTDGEDLLAWQRQLGMSVTPTVSAAAAAAVAEPTSAALLLAGGLAVRGTRRRRRRS